MSEKTVKQLRDEAKELNIIGRWDMNKEELIEAIKTYKENSSINPEGLQKVTKGTDKYIDRIQEGTLVAFKIPNSESVLSGAVINVHDASVGQLDLETKRGTKFYKIPRNNIIWVRTGKRWPKHVIEMFGNKSRGDDDGRG